MNNNYLCIFGLSALNVLIVFIFIYALCFSLFKKLNDERNKNRLDECLFENGKSIDLNVSLFEEVIFNKPNLWITISVLVTMGVALSKVIRTIDFSPYKLYDWLELSFEAANNTIGIFVTITFSTFGIISIILSLKKEYYIFFDTKNIIVKEKIRSDAILSIVFGSIYMVCFSVLYFCYHILSLVDNFVYIFCAFMYFMFAIFSMYYSFKVQMKILMLYISDKRELKILDEYYKISKKIKINPNLVNEDRVDEILKNFDYIIQKNKKFKLKRKVLNFSYISFSVKYNSFSKWMKIKIFIMILFKLLLGNIVVEIILCSYFLKNINIREEIFSLIFCLFINLILMIILNCRKCKNENTKKEYLFDYLIYFMFCAWGYEIVYGSKIFKDKKFKTYTSSNKVFFPNVRYIKNRKYINSIKNIYCMFCEVTELDRECSFIVIKKLEQYLKEDKIDVYIYSLCLCQLLLKYKCKESYNLAKRYLEYLDNKKIEFESIKDICTSFLVDINRISEEKVRNTLLILEDYLNSSHKVKISIKRNKD